MTIKDRINEKTENMVEKISFNTNVGSFARDIVSSVAIELVKEEDDFETRLDSRFITNATGTDLDICCGDKAIERKPPTVATGVVTIGGANGGLIKKGYKVINSVTEVEYEILEDKVINNLFTKVKIRCLTAGTDGNAGIGVINKFAEFYPELSTVTNEEEISNGKGKETDDELRRRALDLIRKPRMSWNRYVFEDKAREIEEVEKSYCIPRPRGKGTVDIVITQKNREIVEEKIKEDVLNYIDAQIISDIDIKVIGAEIQLLDISITGELSSDFDGESAGIRLKELINRYLFEQIFKDKISYFELVEIIQHSGCFEHLEIVTLNGLKEDFITDVTKLYKVESISLITN